MTRTLFLDETDRNRLFATYTFQDYITGDDNPRTTLPWQAMP